LFSEISLFNIVSETFEVNSFDQINKKHKDIINFLQKKFDELNIDLGIEVI
jgi:hypothetical protein